MTEHPGWWWCLRHNAVEPYEGCAERYRIGPFATREEAARGLEIMHQREERKRREDEDWESGRDR